MIYVKQSGSQWESAYAVDEENKVVSEITTRFSDGSKNFISDYIASTHSAARGTFDPMAVEALKQLDTITKKEWNDVKKAMNEYVKFMEVFSD